MCSVADQHNSASAHLLGEILGEGDAKHDILFNRDTQDSACCPAPPQFSKLEKFTAQLIVDRGVGDVSGHFSVDQKTAIAQPGCTARIVPGKVDCARHPAPLLRSGREPGGAASKAAPANDASFRIHRLGQVPCSVGGAPFPPSIQADGSGTVREQ